MVGCGDKNIVDVEQQSAASAADNRLQELSFADGRFFKQYIGGRVLEKNLTPNHILHVADMAAHMLKGLLGIGER